MSTFYKTVGVDNAGRMWSSWAPERFRAEYKIGEITYPIPGTKLFVCDTVMKAELYLSDALAAYGKTAILKAETDAALTYMDVFAVPAIVPEIETIEDLQTMWKTYPELMDSDFRSGIVLVPHLQILEIIWQGNHQWEYNKWNQSFGASSN